MSVPEVAPVHMFNLLRVLAVLALPSPSQVSYLEHLGTLPLVDELALELGEGHALAPQFVEASWLSERESQIVNEIERCFSDMGQLGEASVWLASALDDNEWTEVRNLATRFFVER